MPKEHSSSYFSEPTFHHSIGGSAVQQALMRPGNNIESCGRICAFALTALSTKCDCLAARRTLPQRSFASSQCLGFFSNMFPKHFEKPADQPVESFVFPHLGAIFRHMHGQRLICRMVRLADLDQFCLHRTTQGNDARVSYPP
jgi:hypothetical protein